MHDVLHDKRSVRLCRVQTCRNIHTLLAMERQTILAFALSQSNLVDVKPTNWLAHYLLLVIQVVSMDLEQLDIHRFLHLLNQRWCGLFIRLKKLNLKLAHPFFDRFNRHFLHLSSCYFIFSQNLPFTLLLQFLYLWGPFARAIATASEHLLLHNFVCHRLLLLLVDDDASTLLEQKLLAVSKVRN